MYLANAYGIPLRMEGTLATFMNVGISLLLGFRINRSFDRYWQGAQLWTQLIIHIRNGARLIWYGLSVPVNERMDMMKTLLAIAVATKESVRGTNPAENELLQLILSRQSHPIIMLGHNGLHQLAKNGNTNVNEEHSRRPSVQRPLPTGGNSNTANNNVNNNNNNNNNNTANETASTNTTSKPNFRPLNNFIPVDLIYSISQTIRKQRTLNNAIEHEDSQAIAVTISGMIDCLTKFEQICSIGMPRAFDIHMKQLLICYFTLLPLQFVSKMGIAVVLCTLIAGFAFYGTELIANEIEEPFDAGDDKFDLPLEGFLAKVKEDIEGIVGTDILTTEEERLAWDKLYRFQRIFLPEEGELMTTAGNTTEPMMMASPMPMISPVNESDFNAKKDK